MADEMNTEQQNIEAAIQAGIQRNFASNQGNEEQEGFRDERLKEMEKRLPKWSLEPPSSFLGK